MFNEEMILTALSTASASSWEVGITSGLISSTIVGTISYFVAGRDLRIEAERLREEAIRSQKMTHLIIGGLEDAGVISVTARC